MHRAIAFGLRHVRLDGFGCRQSYHRDQGKWGRCCLLSGQRRLTDDGPLRIEVPRDREVSLEPVLILLETEGAKIWGERQWASVTPQQGVLETGSSPFAASSRTRFIDQVRNCKADV
jgi:hypothetical protein